MAEEQQLILKAQQGDRAALNALIGQYWQPVYRLIYLKTGNSDDAQELTQETFLKVFRALPSYKKMNASFKTYLGRIALNLVTDYWRRQGRTPPVIDIAEYQEPMVDSAPSPENQTVSAERRAEINKLVATLPPEQRQAIELRVYKGLSVQEAAGVMDKSEAAVKMLQQRALKNLRKLFLEHGITE